MHLTQVHPSQEQLAELMAYPKNTPVVMVNILKFKARTGNGDETGQEAYARYFKNVQPFVAKANAKLIWKGGVATTVIGDSKNQPDILFLVEYPSVDHFLGMVTDAEYQKVAKDRVVALEYGGLIACQTAE
ncbi:MAG TPA: DUF1330 domain-containing protein [Flavobacteriia bacterium]|nr:DUF1330 domain-containing protein [Flavobacteriia bacterium]